MDGGADSVDLRYRKGIRPVKGQNMAIAEWPTGPADYALFAGETCLGIVEAKRYRKNVSAAVDQVERYSKGFDWVANADNWDGGFVVPFVFATNGRPYLKQVETESGIWFRDVRLASNLRRALMGWFRPEELLSMLEVEKEKAQAALHTRSFDFSFRLRPIRRLQSRPSRTRLPPKNERCWWRWPQAALPSRSPRASARAASSPPGATGTSCAI